MKENPRFSPVRERMAPGRLSEEGFLGTDSRSLEDIVADDLAVLAEAGIDRNELADFLDEIHRAADAALETPTTLYDGRLTVQSTEVMGRIPCPFACGYRTHKATIRVTTRTGSLDLTPLHNHLIREHGFFQGRGSAFRLEPRDLIDLYRLARG